MKIQPPGGPPPGPPPDTLGPSAKTEGAPGSGFAAKLEKAGKPEGAEAAQAAQAARPAEAPMAVHLEAVSREMAAGRIQTRDQAIWVLVDRVLDARFEGRLPPDALARMKTAVAAEVAADPHLSERIDRLLGER